MVNMHTLLLCNILMLLAHCNTALFVFQQTRLKVLSFLNFDFFFSLSLSGSLFLSHVLDILFLNELLVFDVNV